MVEAWYRQALLRSDSLRLMVAYIFGAPTQEIDVRTGGDKLSMPPIYNIVNPETRILLERLDNGEREPTMELHDGISPEPGSLPRGEADNSERRGIFEQQDVVDLTAIDSHSDGETGGNGASPSVDFGSI